MATTVGSVTCTLIESLEPQELVNRVDTWQVVGRDGYGAQLTGKGEAQARWRLFHRDSSANIDTWISNIRDTVGTVVTITDTATTEHTNQLVQRIARIYKRKVEGDSVDWWCDIWLHSVKVA